MEPGPPSQRKRINYSRKTIIRVFIRNLWNKWVNMLCCMNNGAPLALSAFLLTPLLRCLLLLLSLHSITFSLPMHSGMNASAANFHQTCEMSAKNKDCSCVFNQGKPFVLGTTCGAVASPTLSSFAHLLPLRCLIRVSSPAPFSLKDSSPRETCSLNVPFRRLHFHQGLLCRR